MAEDLITKLVKFLQTHYSCRVYNISMRNIAILLASGVGARVGAECPKQFIQINGKYLFEYSVATFNNHMNIDEIIVVCHPDYIDLVKTVVLDRRYLKVKRVVAGGETRRDSVYNGLFSISYEEGNVLIHDTARPFVTSAMIDRVLGGLESYSAVSTVLPATDTMFVLNEDYNVAKIPNRKELARVQTPQGFYLNTIRKAHYLAQKDNLTFATDDCGLIAYYKLAEIHTVEGDEMALKVTTPVDLIFAKSLADNLSILNS